LYASYQAVMYCNCIVINDRLFCS